MCDDAASTSRERATARDVDALRYYGMLTIQNQRFPDSLAPSATGTCRGLKGSAPSRGRARDLVVSILLVVAFKGTSPLIGPFLPTDLSGGFARTRLKATH